MRLTNKDLFDISLLIDDGYGPTYIATKYNWVHYKGRVFFFYFKNL